MTQSLFLESSLQQFGVADHQVAEYHGHLHHHFPIRILLLACLGFLGSVLVETLVGNTMFLYPFHSLGIFFLVVDAFLDATENLGHINLLGTQAKIFLQEIGVDNTAGNTHRHIADREVRLASHGCHSLGSLGPAQNFFSHIGRDAVVFEVLHIRKYRMPEDLSEHVLPEQMPDKQLLVFLYH